MLKRFCFFIFIGLLPVVTELTEAQSPNQQGLRIATFDVDATPPIGSYMAYQQVVNIWEMGLRARGVVLLGAGQPVVLLAVDWIGISNESQDVFRNHLAQAAGTVPERVAVHTVHQHDAPRCDFTTEMILKNAGLPLVGFESTFTREVVSRLGDAVKQSLQKTQPVTHIGLGKAEVSGVASNRRIMGDDGRVRAGRMSSAKNAELRAEPEGVIDPVISLVSFWNNDTPVAILSYYAVHPQSYYLTSIPNPDFPGVARFLRQLELPDAMHIYFTGAAGNVAAGKYNDGSKENRLILAGRLADGMKRAWEETKKEPVTANDIKWEVEPVTLPLSSEVEKLKTDTKKKLTDTAFLMTKPWNIKARRLALLQRSQEGRKIDVSCLSVGKARILHLPGELFVEYQLAAKKMRPDLFVTMAAYGDCSMGYIGTEISYSQGGYEVGASSVSPEVEKVLMGAIMKLLGGKQQ